MNFWPSCLFALIITFFLYILFFFFFYIKPWINLLLTLFGPRFQWVFKTPAIICLKKKKKKIAPAIYCLFTLFHLSVIGFTVLLLFKSVPYLSYMNISPSACSNCELLGKKQRLYFPCDFTGKRVARHTVLNQLAFTSYCRIFYIVFFFPFSAYTISFQIVLLEQMAPHLYADTLLPAHHISVITQCPQ